MKPRLAPVAVPLFLELGLGMAVGLAGTALAARQSDAAAAGFALAHQVAAMLFILLRIVGAGETGGGTGLAAGKYITDNIYVEIVTDARGYTATQLEIALTKALKLLTSAGSFGGNDVKLKYSKDY